MATTLRHIARRALRTAALPALLMASSACCCPPLLDSYATPDETLATWQSRLCRDDLVGEYACLAASFKSRIGGFPNYHAARAAMLDANAAAAWLFERAALADHLALVEFTPDGLAARLELEALGERVIVRFERETWLTVHWADGSQESLRQPTPLAGLLGSSAGRQWLNIERPDLPPARLGDVRALSVETRWKIADISGVAVGTVRAAARASSPPASGIVP
ncbi:MAG: hypothetical protein ACYTG2_05915 [Planctomycetota bacterium]|jgi:hypothetical protein